VINRAEHLYRLGETAFEQGDFDRSRRAFDDAVDVVLTSGLEMRSNPALRAFYVQLVGKVHQRQMRAQGSDGGFADQAYVPAASEIAELSDAELANLGDSSNVAVNGVYDFEFTVGAPVYQFVNYFTVGRGRGTMETGLRRSGRYRAMAERIFKEEGVPTDMIWLAQVESVWKPAALSHAAAKGIWQFIPSTGRRFGLDQSEWVDRRSSPEESTRAAARYLKWLYNYFAGDWLLAMAAYNSGEGNVSRAIAKSGYADFWEIHRLGYLPTETRNYVPAILAVIIVAHNQKHYNFDVTPEPPLTYDLAQIPTQTDLDIVAEFCGTSVEYIRELNPELKRGLTPPWAHALRIPAGRKKDFDVAYAALPADQRLKRAVPAMTDSVVAKGDEKTSGFGGGNAKASTVLSKSKKVKSSGRYATREASKKSLRRGKNEGASSRKKVTRSRRRG
jgi:membrane-bound lytic murein transglycosylase D